MHLKRYKKKFFCFFCSKAKVFRRYNPLVTSLREQQLLSFATLRCEIRKTHYTVFSTTPIHQIWVSLTFGVFSASVSHSVSQSFSQSASLCCVTERRDVSEQVFQGAQGRHVCLRSDWWGWEEWRAAAVFSQPAGLPGINVMCHVLRGNPSVSRRSNRQTDGAHRHRTWKRLAK